ncbi:hypothetical protein BDR05DRAFT_963508 [Suillus weaverae]|nr:hypothetical protein BDR05DRAFT_963508 [Suillus weaverae]
MGVLSWSSFGRQLRQLIRPLNYSNSDYVTQVKYSKCPSFHARVVCPPQTEQRRFYEHTLSPCKAQSCDNSPTSHHVYLPSRPFQSRRTVDSGVWTKHPQENTTKNLTKNLYSPLSPPHSQANSFFLYRNNIRVYQILRVRFCLQVVVSNTCFISCLTAALP